MCTTKKLKEEIILFEEIKRRFERYKDDYQIEAIGCTDRIGYDILKELYINDRNSNQIEYYENFIKKNLTAIIFNENLNTSLKNIVYMYGWGLLLYTIKYKK